MAASCHVGRDLTLLAEDEHGVELEGSCRLSPGRRVVLFGLAPAPSRGRHACVANWRVVRAGRNGLFYRGYCEWVGAPRPGQTRPDSDARREAPAAHRG